MNKTTTNNTMNPDYQIPELAPELQRGPNWLRDVRKSSREIFNDSPVPRRGLHFWRYTDPTTFLVDRRKVSDTEYGENFGAVEKIVHRHLEQGNLAGVVSDLGGREIGVHGAGALGEKGVVISSLSEAAGRYPELVEKYLYQLVNAATGKFEAMNGALWNDGIFIYVPDGVSVDKPVHLLRESGLAGSAQYPRLLVVVGKNAELTLIDEYGGGSQDFNQPSYANSAVEIFGLDHSRVRYVSLQRQASGMLGYMHHRARIDRGATMLTVPLAFGGAVSKQSFGVQLNGRHAESRMHGMLFGSNYQHFDNHTRHHHSAGETFSNIDFKVVLRDKANSAYTGLIRIENGARTCEAYQENRNLLLNRGAKAETIPELEILNEDVRCSHGATLGPIDPLSIFYLLSRGIEQPEAVRMIVSGFLTPTLNQVPDDLRDRIGGFVAQRLEDS